MTRLSRRFHHAYSSSSQSARGRKSRKFTLWLSGLALVISGLTLAQAGHSRATPAANSAHDTSVRVNASTAGAKPLFKPSTDVTVESNQSSSINSTEDPSHHISASVTVNGHTVPVPKNGSVHESIPSNSGDSNVNISIDSNSNGSATNQSSSSSNISIFSQSNSVSSEADN